MAVFAWGYDATNKVWRPIVVTSTGKLKVKKG